MAEEIEDALPVDEPDALPDEDASAVEDQPAEAPPPKPSLPESLVRRMAKLGMPSERFADLPPTQLEELIEYAEDQKIRQLEERAKQPVHQPQVQNAPAPESDDFDLGEMDDGLGNKIKITERDLPPGVAAAYRKQQAELKELKKSIHEQRKLDEQRRAAEFTEAMDTGFETLGSADIYGKGALADLAPDSEACKRRMLVYRNAGINPQLDSPAAIARKLKAAHETIRAFFGAPKAEEPPATNGTRFTNQQLRQASLLKPTNRKPGKLPEGPEAQQKAAEDFFAKLSTKDEE